MRTTLRFALSMIAGALLLNPPAARGVVVFSDTFTPGDGTGVTGGVLNGTPVETGTGTWAGQLYPEFTAAGTIVFDFSNPNNFTTRVVHVPVSGATITSQISRISSTIRPPFSNGDPTTWVGIGYVNNPGAVLESRNDGKGLRLRELA